MFHRGGGGERIYGDDQDEEEEGEDLLLWSVSDAAAAAAAMSLSALDIPHIFLFLMMMMIFGTMRKSFAAAWKINRERRRDPDSFIGLVCFADGKQLFFSFPTPSSAF